ncbi:nuclear transport factor 2 family protein [Galbibacter sp. BG1]|uniref:YybH family protein n=1 Tax=Galbibacter sp. BG1 TaxID=1170699 RepID=UPI0015B7A5DF|nr:nuclear transport factor 2 family protein [Galbibacter sp. BG1]QLE02439.1 nuclear transport factor 2 family protein [Galbibacter sp. BG1]
MKILIPIASLIFLTSCSRATHKENTFTPEDEKKAIIAMTNERFERMLAEKDPQKIAQIYTENTVANPVYMPQNDEVLIGKQAILKWGVQFFRTYALTAGNSNQVLYDNWIISPTTAVHRYESKGYFIELSTGDSIKVDQKTTDVFEKVNGKWLYSSHMWNCNSEEIKMFNPDCN